MTPLGDGVVAHRPTEGDLLHVAANMRACDRAEAFAVLPVDSAELLAQTWWHSRDAMAVLKAIGTIDRRDPVAVLAEDRSHQCREQHGP